MHPRLRADAVAHDVDLTADRMNVEAGEAREPSDNDAHLVHRLIHLVGSFDLEAAFEMMTDDVILELPFRADGGPRRMEGDNARAFIRSLPVLFSTLRFYDLLVHGSLPSELIVAEYRSEGATRAGRPYRNSYLALFGFSEGRVASWREYFDPLVVRDAFAPD